MQGLAGLTGLDVPDNLRFGRPGVMVGHVIFDLSAAPFLSDNPYEFARKMTPPRILDPIRDLGAYYHPPLTVCQRCGGTVDRHVPSGTCRSTGNAMLPWTSRVPGLAWWISDRDLLTEDLLVADAADGPSQASCRQGLAEGFADAVPGVSQHDPKGGALCQHTVELFQGQIALGTVGVKVFRG